MTSGLPSNLPAHRVGPRELATMLDGWRDDRPGAAGYAALAARLRMLVLDGRLPLRTVLPSERALAVLVGASRTLTTAAYRQLRDEGFAEGRHGSGTWTTLPPGPVDGATDPAEREIWLTGREGVGTGDLSTAAPEAPPELHGALTAALAALPRLLPGHGYAPAGLGELRAAIAARYTRRGLPTTAEEIVVTSGAQQGLRLALAVTVRAGDRVVAEDPSWPQALDAVRGLGGRPVGLPVEDGWDPRTLRGLVRRTGAGVAYLMPDGQNPTGRLLDGETRRRLVTALADGGCLAIVDESHAELDLRADLGQPGALTPAPFGAGTRPGTVLHVGSLSKVVWGGLRIGWVRADRPTVRRLIAARVQEDLGGPPVEQLAAVHLLDGFEPLVRRRRTEAATRCRALQRAVARDLPEWSAPDPEAGLSLWIRLPDPASVAISLAARGAGLVLAPGQRFGVDGGFAGRIRLTFSAPPEQLEDAVHRLAAAVHGLDLPDPVDGAARTRVV